METCSPYIGSLEYKELTSFKRIRGKPFLPLLCFWDPQLLLSDQDSLCLHLSRLTMPKVAMFASGQYPKCISALLMTRTVEHGVSAHSHSVNLTLT